VFCRDRQTRLRAIIAIHDTTLGPGRGSHVVTQGVTAKVPATAALSLLSVLSVHWRQLRPYRLLPLAPETGDKESIHPSRVRSRRALGPARALGIAPRAGSAITPECPQVVVASR